MKRLFLSMIIACASWVAGMAQETYTVEILSTENGEVTSDKATASEGETVTLTLTPAYFYRLDLLAVESELIGGGFSDDDAWGPALSPAYIMVPTTKVSENLYTFVMPASKVKVLATFALIKMGDVNGDGNINITDVTMLISYACDGLANIDLLAADLNGDGNINITDVTMLINMVING